LIGIPLTGGFFGKFYIFKAAVDSNLIWLAILGALNSAVAAYYYLRVLVVMYMKEPGDAVETSQPMAPGISFTLWASALGTLLLGIFPSAVLDFVRNSSSLAK
jgi:NADH-quinone oxidoreductase subunit N